MCTTALNGNSHGGVLLEEEPHVGVLADDTNLGLRYVIEFDSSNSAHGALPRRVFA